VRPMAAGWTRRLVEPRRSGLSFCAPGHPTPPSLLIARRIPRTSLGDMTQLSAEDQKLVTLARATMARVGAPEGAAVRDLDGRTYAAAAVALDSLTLTALEVCVAMAVSSGSTGLEAVVRLGDVGAPDLRAVHDFAGGEVVVHLGDARGRIFGT